MLMTPFEKNQNKKTNEQSTTFYPVFVHSVVTWKKDGLYFIGDMSIKIGFQIIIGSG